jgi:hypothetical protein
MKRQWKWAMPSTAADTRAEAAFRAFEPALSSHCVSFGASGKPRMLPTAKLSATDGPFAETKEGLGGFIVVNDRNQDGGCVDAGPSPASRWMTRGPASTRFRQKRLQRNGSRSRRSTGSRGTSSPARRQPGPGGDDG